MIHRLCIELHEVLKKKDYKSNMMIHKNDLQHDLCDDLKMNLKIIKEFLLIYVWSNIDAYLKRQTSFRSSKLELVVQRTYLINYLNIKM